MGLNGIGNRIKMIRQDRGFTQKQLAGLLGVTEQAVSKWEREISYPDITILNGISEVMNCSFDYLFQYESDKNNLLNQDSVEQRTAITKYLLPDIISIEFGGNLIPVFLEEEKHGYPNFNKLRCKAASQWGIVLPSIHITDQLKLKPDQYKICINGTCVYKDNLMETDENAIICIIEKLKENILKNIEFILNNQTIYYMVENLRSKYPYVVENIVPDIISYSKLRQVIIHLLKDYKCNVNPLILIIESIERHTDITDLKKLAEKVREDITIIKAE